MRLPLALSALITAADQLLKWWVRETIPYQTTVGFLPGALGLTYEKNTGGAWSVLADHTWLLTIASSVAVLAILVALLRPMIEAPLGRWPLAAVLGGALGNLIDRALLGYVVDMFYFPWIRFPVFNVADVAIVTGGVLFCIYLVFFHEEYEKERNRARGQNTPFSRYRGRRRPR